MAQVSKKALHEALRQRFMSEVIEYFEGKDEEILRTGSNEICLPCVDSEGNDEFIVITFKVPTGSRDGEAYDGYGMAEDYQMKQTTKAEKAAKAAEVKARRIAKDKAQREAKAKSKAEHEAKNNTEPKGQTIGGQMVRKMIEAYEKEMGGE